MSGWSFTICFLLLSVGSSLQACSDYYDCVDCVNGGCGWCDNTEACLSLSSSSSCTNSSQCFKSSTAFGAKCSSVSCSSLTNCYSCVNSGCGWCDTSHSCVPIHNDGTEPCGSNCPNNTQCFKNSIAFGAKCPTADCSSNTNCYTCVQKGCGWCDITSQCLPTYNDGSQPCVGNCTDQCYKNSIAYGAKCASVSCSSYTDCNSCVIGGCGWCDITHKCLPTFNDATAPCIENCTDQCYKISTAYGAKCPTTNCSSFLNCSTCVDRGCGWCDITGTCLPTYNNGSQPCIGNCTDQCYKRSTAFGAKCPTKSCANYTNCNACAIGGCGWCDSTQQCLPVFNNGSGPCQENCPENDQCWKTSTAFGAACASQSCSLYKNCYSCASSGCGWCSASQTCLPRTNNNTAFCMGDCTNSSTCFKTSTSFSSMCETYSCNAFNSCVSCMNKDSCTWCASQGICVEQGYGDTLCSNCTDPVPAGQCPDCESYGCKNNATCMSSGFCNCSENYFGYYCEQYCYAPTTCSNKGICTDSGTCNCDMYYYGANCSIYCNANTTCQGRGFCYGGTCTCNAPYYGPTCDTYCDPSVTCSSNGYCTSQGCQCYYSYYGQDCSTHCDPITSCNGNGVCDSNGKCQCTTGSGSDCATSKSLSGGAIAGIFFSVLIPAIIAAFCCYKKLKRTPYYDPPTSNQSFNNNNNYTAQATLTRLTPDMSEFTSVKQVFYDKWTKGDPEKIKILGILTVNNSNIHTKYKSYQSRMSSHSSNVQQVFHGTKLSASCMLHSASTLCRHSDCAICCITNEGFKLSKSGTNITFARFGRGIYFAPNSSKANDYNEAAVRAMLVCDVLAGNEYHSEDNMQTLTAPPTGYHSVRGIVGTKLNYPELVVYDEDAILVTNIILYSVSS